MNLPLSWLKDYMDFDVPVQDYCDGMTMSGSKVEGYEEQGAGFTGVVVGKILKKEKHPDADSLWVCQVDLGDHTSQIITAAQNVFEGAYVPISTPGAVLADGTKIKKGKLRGLPSEGMMCSYQELGLELEDVPGAVEDGILIFQEEYPLGKDVREVLNLTENVVEFEITSNRPDCLSVLGLARESAVTFGLPFRKPTIKETGNGELASDYASVTVEASDLCPRYIARIVKNLKIEPSPKWMRERLQASGVRPINNIVDITNYVMLEYGQPMHAFDLNFLEGNEIRVRRAKEGEEIVTLDGQPRKLDSEMLVICDQKKPVAIAGVMGGENSEITDDTKTLLFESACFVRGTVRRTTRKLGMRTESSARYEKGLDPNNCLPAINRACELIELLGAGEVVGGMIDADNSNHDPYVLDFRPDKINEFLGSDIDTDFMVKTLEALDFTVDLKNMKLTVPSARADVEGEADVAEEVARIYGYNKIGSSLVSGETTIGGKKASMILEDKISECLIAQGHYEIMTYSFTNPKSLDLICATDAQRQVIRIKNPLGEENSIMRTTMISSVMEVLSRNYNQRNANVKVFEIGKVYIPKALPLSELPDEKKKIVLGAYGDVDFYHLKGAVEALFDTAGVKNYSFAPLKDNDTFHPGKTASVYINTKEVGVIGEIHPEVSSNYGIDVATYVAELDFASILKASSMEKTYKPLGKFPAVTRDIAMLVDDNICVAQIEEIIRKFSGKLLEELTLFDVYKGKQIPEGKKSVAYSALYRADNRTLTDDDINKIFDKIVKNLSEQLGAQLR